MSSEKFLAEAIKKSQVKLNETFSETQWIQILTTDDYKNVEDLARNILASSFSSSHRATTLPQTSFETADLSNNF